MLWLSDFVEKLRWLILVYFLFRLSAFPEFAARQLLSRSTFVLAGITNTYNLAITQPLNLLHKLYSHARMMFPVEAQINASEIRLTK